MQAELKRNFTVVIAVLVTVMLGLITLSTFLAGEFKATHETGVYPAGYAAPAQRDSALPPGP